MYRRIWKVNIMIHVRLVVLIICTGPYYILGSPDRTIDEGKAVIATADELKSMLRIH